MSELTIHEAASRGDLDRLRAIIERDPSAVNADDEHEWRPIFHAGLWGRLGVVEYLLRQGADVAAHDGYALHYAAEVPNNKEIVELLILHGALEAHVRPPSDTYRQFVAAVFLADESRVAAFLREDPTLATTYDGRGDLALNHAARNGDVVIMNLLIEHGASVNADSRSDQMPLYSAAGHGHVEAVHLLLSRGADTKAKMSDGKTVLEWCYQYAESNPRIAAVVAVLEHWAAAEQK